MAANHHKELYHGRRRNDKKYQDLERIHEDSSQFVFQFVLQAVVIFDVESNYQDRSAKNDSTICSIQTLSINELD